MLLSNEVRVCERLLARLLLELIQVVIDVVDLVSRAVVVLPQVRVRGVQELVASGDLMQIREFVTVGRLHVL